MSRALRSATVAVAVVLSLTGCAGPAQPAGSASDDGLSGEVTVYAAASLAGAFDAMSEAFTVAHPDVKVSPVYDGSATLVTQILEGAPADVFASADEANMQKAAELTAEPTVFATNTLVIAVPEGNPAGVETLADLDDVTTVLCAPEVPCGAASAELLETADVTIEAASVEQNVTAVLTKVAAGEADAGLVYSTDVIGRDDVDAIVPEGAHEVVNRYPIATLADARNAQAADVFVSFVLSGEGQSILSRFGFGAP
ncbi:MULTISPECIES: molybdate ABC transporter substrate-binding protein [unclassified Microbacterium]|uniref:molybdate ABC transporter substrate-binding protein n=1 Tax=unclassified Microbacterium TaxID=2609290 RepID=UPI000EA8D36C|nr:MULTISPECIES: molybdate ABC transporter substrate-binding protein [unclassified Microbacterium]MBT2484397.1 molybdate ABC transporter substrate-binding protein [Microbacterium sp. ISL-108]RKN67308.1 molybdate ABC transporter substrate-binding protein [Microbacterium sp. CGR2]